MKKVFLIDDHPAIRHGLKTVLTQDGWDVCGEAGSIAEVDAAINCSGATVVIVDISLGNESGLQIINSLCSRGIAVLVYSMHEDSETIDEAFAAGAIGYASKREPADALLDALDAVAQNRRHISPFGAQSLANRALANTDSVKISERERLILRFLSKGKTVGEIADQLSLSSSTIETYCSRLRAKLDLASMKELKNYARQNLTPPHFTSFL
jgi:DNA-binding NarL/FixJ family response regulator